MLRIKIEKSFKKDIARDKKNSHYSEKDFGTLKSIIRSLQNQEEINKKFKRRPLKGSMKELESVHIKSNWLLIFKMDENYLCLIMLSKHTQVYKKFS